MLASIASSRKLWTLVGYAAAAAALFSAPLYMSDFRLNLLAKCLAFAIVALGLDLLWGYTGTLSLGHGVFFGLGAYAMAMHLKLTASGQRIPSEAMSTRARIACSRTRVDTSSAFLKPPPSAPSTTRPSTPASTHLTAASTVGTA